MSEITLNVKGMRDLLRSESQKKVEIEHMARSVAMKYGFQEINTPLIEFSSVFEKSLGQNSDIIGKEMYNLEDKKGRKLTLRPEATAGIARAVASNGLEGSGDYRLPLKLFLFGPMFRYEQTQKGRYRQFYQINFESFDTPMPESDVELITVAHTFLKTINVSIDLSINTLGDKQSRNAYKEKLVSYLSKFMKDLSEDSKKRLNSNPLRILDSKNPNDMKIILDSPKIVNYLTKDSKKYYDKIKILLNDLNIDFKEDSNLVRGLDYYKDTVFEFKTKKLGKQQDTILGGGRYTDLVNIFGGKQLGGIGWAAGMDRLIEILPKTEQIKPRVSIIFLEKYRKEAYRLAYELRKNSKNYFVHINFTADMAIEKQLKKSSRLDSEYIITIENNNEAKITDKFKKTKIFKVSSIEDIKKIIF
ncbi:MAG: histidine--tRNA ligase [Pelagibacteraceae bacterium]|nr:histidine--tRNA ligase [Pelagibacteraceae bacterium]PPR50337.1 MAG: Histidine--tRNA ligase [Alphaproteobacteria bacterium MarineAlpha5_Bin10]|tara:strand:+ start:8653 stop:9903 length:1251 start_codon:yes stop_codon:yes gene_type:complete